MEPSVTNFFQLPKPRAKVVITVQLGDGTLVDRDPSNLVNIPQELNVPLATLAPVKDPSL